MPRIGRPPIRYPSVASPPLGQCTVPAMHVKFKFGMHNSMYDRTDFGDEAQMPELLIGTSELYDACGRLWSEGCARYCACTMVGSLRSANMCATGAVFA